MSSEVDIRVSASNPAEHIPADEAGRAHPYLKQTPFLLAMYVLEHKTNPQRGAFIRMSARAVDHALSGGVVGGDFIAATMLALAKHADKLAKVNLMPVTETFFEYRYDAEASA